MGRQRGQAHTDRERILVPMEVAGYRNCGRCIPAQHVVPTTGRRSTVARVYWMYFTVYMPGDLHQLCPGGKFHRRIAVYGCGLPRV
jgi:hypothetical protein